MEITAVDDKQGIFIDAGQPIGILSISTDYAFVTTEKITHAMLLTRKAGESKSFMGRLSAVFSAAKFIFGIERAE